MPTAAEQRVDLASNRIEFDDDLAVMEGVPFTGIMFSNYDDGLKAFEACYRDGLPDGLREEWYPNGQLYQRDHMRRGRGSRESWVWYPNGILRSHRLNGDNGFPIELSAWDEAGEPIDPSTLAPVARSDVERELFARAITLKSSKTSGSATDQSFDGD